MTIRGIREEGLATSMSVPIARGAGGPARLPITSTVMVVAAEVPALARTTGVCTSTSCLRT